MSGRPKSVLFLCSHNPDVVETGIFRDVRLIRPAREGFVPYRDYIGSQLEVLEVATGRRRVVHRSAEPFEAPNWTRDGAALIFNTRRVCERLSTRVGAAPRTSPCGERTLKISKLVV